MIGLMTSGPPCAISSSIDADHSNHSPSSARTSSSTFVSTSVPRTSAPEQSHDLIRRHASLDTPTHVLDDLTPPGTLSWTTGGLRHADRIAVDREFDLCVGQQPELLADLEGDRHLALTGHPH